MKIEAVEKLAAVIRRPERSTTWERRLDEIGDEDRITDLMEPRSIKVIVVFGTRPEIIKLAPIVHELVHRQDEFQIINVQTSQQADLVGRLQAFFGLENSYDLEAMRGSPVLNNLCARLIAALDRIISDEVPDVVLVQGDTTTALAGALAARHRRVPVAHIEAGLRTNDPDSPFPEESNRRLITQLATYHFAATERNVATLRAEGVPAERIALTGNPVVDALQWTLRATRPSPEVAALLAEIGARRLLVLTTHRRESFGATMRDNLFTLRRFVEQHDDLVMVFPVHPNPAVRGVAVDVLGGSSRIKLIAPLDYADFLHLLAHAWLIVSDSGGIQEEAPSLGKPLLVLRENTERPEVVECGIARLVGKGAARLEAELAGIASDDSWARHVRTVENPFGNGDSARRIVDALACFLTRARAEA